MTPTLQASLEVFLFLLSLCLCNILPGRHVEVVSSVKVYNVNVKDCGSPSPPEPMAPTLALVSSNAAPPTPSPDSSTPGLPSDDLPPPWSL